MANWKLPAELQDWVDLLAGGLQARLQHRLTAIVVDIVFAIGRRTVSKWIVAADSACFPEKRMASVISACSAGVRVGASGASSAGEPSQVPA